MHFFSASALLAIGVWLDLGLFYFIGWAIAATLLALENRMIRADDLTTLHSPFFKYNSSISMIHLVFTILALVA
jgi:4-hydroxybenzoate polyprenyltransferase